MISDPNFRNSTKKIEMNSDKLESLREKLYFNKAQHDIYIDRISHKSAAVLSKALIFEKDNNRDYLIMPKIRVIPLPKNFKTKRTKDYISLEIPTTQSQINESQKQESRPGIKSVQIIRQGASKRVPKQNTINITETGSKNVDLDGKFRLDGIRTHKFILYTTSNTSLRTDSRDGASLDFVSEIGYLIGGLYKAPADQMTIYNGKKEVFEVIQTTGVAPDERS